MTDIHSGADLARFLLRIEMSTLPPLPDSAVRMLVDCYEGRPYYPGQSGAKDAALLLQAGYVTHDHPTFYKTTDAGRRRVLAEGLAAARNLHLKGESLHYIAKALNHAGFPTPAGARWTSKAVALALKRYSNPHTDSLQG